MVVVSGMPPIASVNFRKQVGIRTVNLMNSRSLLAPAIAHGFAIPFVNVRIFPRLIGGEYKGPSAVRSVIMAMQELKAPFGFEIAQTEMKYCGVTPKDMVEHVITEVAKARVELPFSIHFDHGVDTKIMIECVAQGFTSVAYDGGKSGNPVTEADLAAVGVDAKQLLKDLETAKVIKKGGAIKPTKDLAKLNEALDEKGIKYTAAQRQQIFDVLRGIERENWEILIKNAQEWVQYVHPRGISIEGEMETIGGQMATDPDKALEFINRTGVDIIVVAFEKNAHGEKEGTSEVDPKLLDNIAAKIPEDVAENLHGGSGFGDDQKALAVEKGISKLNYATEGMRQMLQGTPYENMLIQLAQVESEQKAAASGKSAEQIGDVKEARNALVTLFNQQEWLNMGKEMQARIERQGAEKLISVARVVGNVDTARYYKL